MSLTPYAASPAVHPGVLPPPAPAPSAAPVSLLPPPQLSEHRKVRPSALPAPARKRWVQIKSRPALPSPAGRLQKRLRAARRCWRVSGLESLLWPFRQRFSLAAAPDRSLPLRAMLDPAPRAAAPTAAFPLPAPAAILSEGSGQGRPRPAGKRCREAQRGRAQSGLSWETGRAQGQPPARAHRPPPCPSRWPVTPLTPSPQPGAGTHALRSAARRDVTVTPRPEGRTALRGRAMWYVRLRLAPARRMRFPPGGGARGGAGPGGGVSRARQRREEQRAPVPQPAMAAAYRLVLVRHGESAWNLENRFSGWYDADLSPAGQQEARRGGEALRGTGERGRGCRPVGGLRGTGGNGCGLARPCGA